MPYKPTKSASKRWRKPLILILVFLVCLGVGLYVYQHRSKPVVTPSSQQAIKQLPPHPSANNGEKQPTSSSQINQGTSTDNHGSVTTPVTTNPNQWTTSQSGLITVKEPGQNATIKSGAILTGTAQVSKVQYTLIDNQVGVISQGVISVVNNTFSANMNFTPYAATGRLDVYSTDANGREVNVVEIPVNLSK